MGGSMSRFNGILRLVFLLSSAVAPTALVGGCAAMVMGERGWKELRVTSNSKRKSRRP